LKSSRPPSPLNDDVCAFFIRRSFHPESIRFEEMGPVIINADGTTRRIDNWDQMTKGEQEVAWRRIAKRNEERREALLEQQRRQQEQNVVEDEERKI
jgi:hypothetical protein